MISGIQGMLAHLGINSVFILASGVEYEIHVPLNVFDFIEKRPPGAEVSLRIHHHFSQEGQKLYGFMDQEQREVFRALLDLPGMGPSLALSVLSHYDGPTLLHYCEAGDIAALTQIPRVGDKTARRLAFEIQGKKERFRKLLSGGKTPETDRDLAVQALLQLGYREAQIKEAMAKLDPQPAAAADWIAQTLRIL